MQYPSENLPVPAPKLLDQVRGKMRLKHYSIRAQQAYTNWIKRFNLHFGKKHSRDIGRSGEMEHLVGRIRHRL
jgi:hypothetical protein